MFAYSVSLRSVTLTGRQRGRRVESGQGTLVVTPFVGTMRLMTGRRGRGIGSAGVRRKTGRRWRRGDGQTTVSRSGATIGGRGVGGNAGRIGRIEVGRGRRQAERGVQGGTGPGRRAINTSGSGVWRRWSRLSDVIIVVVRRTRHGGWPRRDGVRAHG